jgi:serine/threonine-protein kinase
MTRPSEGRPYSLRPPIANEEERAQFQRRIVQVTLLVFLLAFGHWLISTVSIAIFAPAHLPHVWTMRAGQMYIGTIAFVFVAWRVARARPWTASLLGWIDAVTAVGLCTGWALNAAFQTMSESPELVALVASAYTLTTRAALIPSTPLRTAILGFLGFAPLAVVAQMRSSSESVQPAGVWFGIWVILGCISTTAISWTIYGLRLQVRKAMQLGQYVLDQKIGEGGMGVVYRASHAMLRRPTAIKLLQHASAMAVERFEREVQITASLTHPNTIAIFDYGRTPDGIFYYAMEYIEGISIEDLVARHGPQSPERVVHVMIQVAGALDEAHRAHLVHRDIKPANLMLTTRGGIRDVVKVLDFGLVKERIENVSPAITNAATIIGTPHYLAPESILDPGAVDGRADIYALGATAYFMLTGHVVFDGANLVEVCGKHLHEPPSPPSAKGTDVPPSLDRLILSCLAKKPDARPSDAAVLAEALRASGVGVWTKSDADDWWSQIAPSRAVVDVTGRTPSMESVAIALQGRI